jgi:hypothetical protein
MAFSYASCVQYVPNSKGKVLLRLGCWNILFTGDGVSWKQLTDSKADTIRFINATTTVRAKIK